MDVILNIIVQDYHANWWVGRYGGMSTMSAMLLKKKKKPSCHCTGLPVGALYQSLLCYLMSRKLRLIPQLVFAPFKLWIFTLDVAMLVSAVTDLYGQDLYSASYLPLLSLSMIGAIFNKPLF